MKRIAGDSDVRDNLDEALDDRHSEGVTFVRDDSGIWFAKTKTDHGAYRSEIWWMLDEGDDADSAIAERLDELVEQARTIGTEPW